MSKVLITGGTGLIGRQLCKYLTEKGYTVCILSRNARSQDKYQSFNYDYKTNTIDEEALLNTDYIIHLAGANIGEKRWSDARKKEIVESRVAVAAFLHKKITENNIPLKAYISASAVGFYGAVTCKNVMTELDAPATDFLGQTCVAWESIAQRFAESGIRNVVLRTGVVLSAQGGALSKMMMPVKWGLGAALGSGRQFMPWIHIDDLCKLYVFALEQESLRGIYNATAPQHCTNAELTKQLATVLHRPFWPVNVPSFVLKLMYGQMADMLLKGSAVSSEKIMKEGFQFTFSKLEMALCDVIR